ncbi:hypothetical protein A8H39_00300 [Paraburkholderia fungorum]|uniref:hypothetical protein n=1 Tax=Paraburkholderia fungorum TaxID=134537 RepID=UPI00047F48CF|nr:hypothetical protein [Paraburkholderia fungorum]PNE59624.1 hypothetical protein A8H39_00300 [Paraburkholderia fungorum]
MNGKFERAALHACGLAAAVLHLLIHGHDVVDERGDPLWSTPADSSGSPHYEVRLTPDHRYAAVFVSAGGAHEGKHFEMLDAAIVQIIDWREQYNGCSFSRSDDGHVMLPAHA